MNNHPIARLADYLKELKTLLSQIDPGSQVYKEGTSAGQISFHATQVVNFWIRVRILGGVFDRDRDSELSEPHLADEVNKSIDLAIEACEQLSKKELDLNEKLKEPVTMGQGAFTIDSIGSAISFITAHTAEHVAELTMVRDYVSTLRL